MLAQDPMRLTWAVLLVSLALGISIVGVAHGGDLVPGDATEAPFLAENDVAMTKMMDGMAIKPSGDVDVDFVAMMIPHHQGAIDMAEAELRHGRNEQLRRIAQGIVVEQSQEIAAMRMALGQPATGPRLAHRSGGSPMSPASMQMKAAQQP